MRVFWGWVKKMWARAKKGAAILGDLGAYVKLVLIPQMGGYVAKVMVIIVFLAAYKIPVTFGSVMSVSARPAREHPLVHPGASASIRRSTRSPSTATRTRRRRPPIRSSQQLITTAFNVGFAVILICVVFGWSGGFAARTRLYSGAKEKASEMRSNRARRSAATPTSPNQPEDGLDSDSNRNRRAVRITSEPNKGAAHAFHSDEVPRVARLHRRRRADRRAVDLPVLRRTAATAVSIVFGIGLIACSLITDYELACGRSRRWQCTT